MTAIGIIDYTPSWARSPRCPSSDKCQPSDAALYAKFAATAAARYAPMGLHTWEIWNEENITDFWKPAPNTAAYTQLLKLSYSAIKRVDPHSFVLTGGFSSAGTGDQNLSAIDFLKGIYANGGHGYFDAVADHPYTRTYLPTLRTTQNAWLQMASTNPSLRSIMLAHGDGAKKIWITEFGAPTGGPGPIASDGSSLSDLRDDHVTPALQASMASVAVSLVRTYPWVGAFIWYSYQDPGTSSSDNENFYGLVRADGSFKPAYYAYQAALTQ